MPVVRSIADYVLGSGGGWCLAPRRRLVALAALIAIGPTLLVPVPKWHHHSHCRKSPCRLEPASDYQDHEDGVCVAESPYRVGGVLAKSCPLCVTASLISIEPPVEAPPVDDVPVLAVVAGVVIEFAHTAPLPINPRGPPLTYSAV
ncbi:MAG: hypothetical protein KKB50_18020 [Planctomycetes bacterium]|nr:hypothetical protein [Planctomycetota bacterium]